jgi:hypothetical protein
MRAPDQLAALVYGGDIPKHPSSPRPPSRGPAWRRHVEKARSPIALGKFSICGTGLPNELSIVSPELLQSVVSPEFLQRLETAAPATTTLRILKIVA